MHVNDPLASQKIASIAERASSAATPARTGVASHLDASTHAPAPEIATFIEKLHETPQIREEVVREVAQRLARGDYAAPQAARRTVEAIFDSAGK